MIRRVIYLELRVKAVFRSAKMDISMSNRATDRLNFGHFFQKATPCNVRARVTQAFDRTSGTKLTSRAF